MKIIQIWNKEAELFDNLTGSYFPAASRPLIGNSVAVHTR